MDEQERLQPLLKFENLEFKLVQLVTFPSDMFVWDTWWSMIYIYCRRILVSSPLYTTDNRHYGRIEKCYLKRKLCEAIKLTEAEKSRIRPGFSMAVSFSPSQFLLCRQHQKRLSKTSENLNGVCTILSPELQEIYSFEPASLGFKNISEQAQGILKGEGEQPEFEVCIGMNNIGGKKDEILQKEFRELGNDDLKNREASHLPWTFSGIIITKSLTVNVLGVTIDQCEFALVQYGTEIKTIFDLNDSQEISSGIFPIVRKMPQLGKTTKTASAIQHVLDNIFNESQGSNQNAKRFIIVVTDGEIFRDERNLTDVINSDKMANITRIAVGILEDHRPELDGRRVYEDDLRPNGNKLNRKRDRYSVVTVKGKNGQHLYIAGAPRHSQTGRVLVFQAGTSVKIKQLLAGKQLGSYFGSELCSLDINNDNVTDYLLVGAPFFHVRGEEGMVYVYQLNDKDTFEDKDSLTGISSFTNARFGVAIANIGDINMDGYNDVAIGAPLEEDHSGSIYIFNGHKDGIYKTYSQRISGKDVMLELLYFGQSISGASDVDTDGILDITVGARDNVVVLSSRPVINIGTNVTFLPKLVPLSFASSHGQEKIIQATVCFMAQSNFAPLDLTNSYVNYTINLDTKQKTKRVTFAKNDGTPDSISDYVNISSAACKTYSLIVQHCTMDCVSAIIVEVNYTLNNNEKKPGLPLPILDHFSNPSSCVESSQLADIKCTDQATSSLSFLSCEIFHPVFKRTSPVEVSISWDLGSAPFKEEFASVSINVSNKNEIGVAVHDTHNIPVRHGFNVFLKAENQITEVDISNGAEFETVKLNFQVTMENPYNASVCLVLSIPVKIQNRQILDPQQEPLKHCLRTQKIVKQQPEQKRKDQWDCDTQGCECQHFQCELTAAKQDIDLTARLLVNNLKQLVKDRANIVISGIVDFDENRYQETSDAKDVPHSVKMHVTIVNTPVFNAIPVVAGSTVGGILLLFLIILILYKCGFFKRSYKDMIEFEEETEH
ncbi:integrin alpha-E-like [Rhincodon typus]|uniref:integrin alpha-E-like n=1 Tax=Rhincodon typus TaxID=259920 RepID=UPI00202FA37A|nr:integrin alpha-E-like [Rhincodon typus]